MRKLASVDSATAIVLMLPMRNYALLVWRLNWTHLTKPPLRSYRIYIGCYMPRNLHVYRGYFINDVCRSLMTCAHQANALLLFSGNSNAGSKTGQPSEELSVTGRLLVITSYLFHAHANYDSSIKTREACVPVVWSQISISSFSLSLSFFAFISCCQYNRR